ncbi:C-X-C motif chemokine 11-6-like [Xyrauchen texanus]|uniref:C-X-C motif chemokine 11-6-like n=1 Tax=Xyrauchen texanus TaxID=154827 RepID=UPI0022419709|nr:C-X-C motif chemokine 11-6-like [Xyrauchen texanus]
MKTGTYIVLLISLFAVEVKGQAKAIKGRCLCADKGVNMVLPKMIEKVEIIPPSPSCENQEIVVTLKNGTERKCLNPESNFTKNYIMKAVKQRSKQKEQPAI